LIRHSTLYVVTPVQRGMRAVTETFRRVIFGYLDLRQARRQSQDFSRELDQLRLEAQRLRREASQAKRLQALLDFRQELPLLTIAAQVIGSSGNEASQIVILDKGTNAGLRPDLPVIVPGGVVGKVLRVFADTSQVILITDANSGVASLLESSRIHGVLRGSNRPLSRLTYVLNGEPVTVGETLVTSGEDRIYPKGLPLGVVVSVRPGSEFQEIDVQPLARLNRLEEVLVVLERETTEEWKPAAPFSREESTENPEPQATPVEGPPLPPMAPPPGPVRPQATPPAISP
jgi:rod shape-determining protein MreC